LREEITFGGGMPTTGSFIVSLLFLLRQPELQ
jgi:hypothetical protein